MNSPPSGVFPRHPRYEHDLPSKFLPSGVIHDVSKGFRVFVSVRLRETDQISDSGSTAMLFPSLFLRMFKRLPWNTDDRGWKLLLQWLNTPTYITVIPSGSVRDRVHSNGRSCVRCSCTILTNRRVKWGDFWSISGSWSENKSRSAQADLGIRIHPRPISDSDSESE